MRISGSVALVTGANRGIGRHITRQPLERDVQKVYGTGGAIVRCRLSLQRGETPELGAWTGTRSTRSATWPGAPG